MNKILGILAVFASALAVARAAAPVSTAAPAGPPELVIRQIHYEGNLGDDEARFRVDIDMEAAGKNGSFIKLFEGEVALLPVKLPDSLRIARDGNRYLISAARPGRFKFQLELIAKIQRAEPWNQIAFSGPPAAIASVAAQAVGSGIEVEMLSGLLQESLRTNGVSRVRGFLGADSAVALRWQGKVAEVARKAVMTVDTAISAQISPAVVKYITSFHFDMVQGAAGQLTLTLPASQALTRLAGEQIRDWRAVSEGNRQILTIEFIKPIEKNYDLVVYSEQSVESPGDAVALSPPQPVDAERESGTVNLFAEDTLVEIESLSGLRQVNAPEKMLAAYRFNVRPFSLALRLKRIEPVIDVADRVSARLEETRLLVSHALALQVEKAGVYAVELLPPPGFAVADVRGQGIEDWKAGDGKLRINFSARVLGSRRLDVQLEQSLKKFPDRIQILPMRLAGAARESVQIGAASAPGIQVKTAQSAGLREIPASRLSDRTDDLLAYSAEKPDWELTLASERLAAHVVADVFNLVTIGDGVLGGSATLRYSLLNQGVQEFAVRLPARCRNVEFTGPNIRRKELLAKAPSAGSENNTNEVVWIIGLQDKVWGGYTLVATYDYQFDPGGGTLPIAGVHPVAVDLETGSVAITTAASLQLNVAAASETLHRVDEAELPAADRALVTRSVVLGYQYSGGDYALAVDVKHYAEEPVLEAVADRTQITSVLNEAGEMLTEASFMVKNNQKQFQRFCLPKDAKLWSCYVNGRPAKPERDGDWVLASLPRDTNRDQAFAVDIVYAQTNGALGSPWSRTMTLAAPRTDVPNTYAEWQLFVPPAYRLSGFGGNMNVAQGTTYEWLDAWEKFVGFYIQVLREAGGALPVIGVLGFLVIALVISAVRRGWNGILTVLAVAGILAVLGGMLLPALSKAKSRAQRISSINNLKQIGLATRIFSGDNGDRLPVSFEEMTNELGADRITYDVETGQRFTYIGAGLSASDITPDSVIAYGPVANGYCNVLRADGSVESISGKAFAELNQRGLIQRAAPLQVAAQQKEVVRRAQQLSSDSPAETGLAIPGARAIRIELPQSGQPFLFTKVLNVRDEPLSIRAEIMPLQTYQTMQMAGQAAAFLLGLAFLWRLWRRPRRNSFLVTVALALVIGSVSSLLIQWRALHDLLILGFPAALVAVIAGVVWKFWPRKSDSADASAPPVMASIVLALSLAAGHARAAEPTGASPLADIAAPSILLANAHYAGVVNDRVAILDATLQFSGAKAGQTIPLFSPDTAVQKFSVKAGAAQLVRENNSLGVRFERGGNAVLEISMLVKVAGDVTKRRLAFEIPPALAGSVSLSLDQAEADVDFPGAVSVRRIWDKEKTRVEAVLGAASRVEILWTPRVKRAAEMAATVFCQNSALVTVGGGVLNVQSTLDYQVTQGELRQVRVRLPAGQRLLRVEAAQLRTWELKNDPEGPVLLAELLKGMTADWRLTVETEKVLESLPASIAIQLPGALGVKRETGLIALRNAEELGLSVESASDLQRVDVEEFARSAAGRAGGETSAGTPAGADKAAGLFSVFRFSKPGFNLRVLAEAAQPQIEAVARNILRVGADQAVITALIDYTIKRAGLFVLKVAVPEDYRVDAVAGSNVLQWVERKNAGRPSHLEVTLKDRMIGSYNLELELSRNYASPPKSFPVTGAHPLDAAKLSGFIAVCAEPGVAVKTEELEGLTEISAASLPDYGRLAGSGGVLAYKFISANPQSAPEWKLSVATETVDAWVRAEVVDLLTVSETLIHGRALVRYDIANSPVKELQIRVPASFRNVEIAGQNLRRKESFPAGARDVVWRVELQSKVRGLYMLTVTWEQPASAAADALDLVGVVVEHTERETGFLAVSAKAPLQLSERAAADLQRADTGELPDWAGRTADTAALAYHYARPGYRLSVKAHRYAEAEVLQALIDGAKLATVVAEDGQMMTEMALSVRNNGKQFLEIELPAGTAVWSAFVAGQPVRPSRREGKLLLPIEQAGAADAAFSVELIYVGTNYFPRGRGEIGFASPRFDTPLKNARWELFLPQDYDYGNFQGTMTREIAPGGEAATRFSSLDYRLKEKANQDFAKAEIELDLSNAQKDLAGGNVREATAKFNRAKGKYYTYGTDAADVKKLEKELSSAQAGNLITAQNEFMSRSGGQAPAANAPAWEPRQLLYDNASAEQQWAKLQQAQEIAAPRAQPLRVNLPVRGSRQAFTQVLQTEAGRSMTIRLSASSVKAVSWPRRLAAGTAGFLALWTLVVLAERAKPNFS